MRRKNKLPILIQDIESLACLKVEGNEEGKGEGEGEEVEVEEALKETTSCKIVPHLTFKIVTARIR